MRTSHQQQQPLPYNWGDHQHAKELQAMDELLKQYPMLGVLAAQDLIGEDVDETKGAPGMSGEQVLRAAIVKQLNGFSYSELSFHLSDSLCYQRFCLMGIGGKPWKRATLAYNIKQLSPATWEAVHRVLIRDAAARGIDKGSQARIDCTVVESNIHRPTDSSLLFDVVRVLARLLARARAHVDFPFANRTRGAKRRSVEIAHAKKSIQRRRAYNCLIRWTIETLAFLPAAMKAIEAFTSTCHDLEVRGELEASLKQLRLYEPLGWQVVDQSFRRVLQDEVVPAAEKVVSIFEEHTDIIVKDRRETLYGHKVFLSAGESGHHRQGSSRHLLRPQDLRVDGPLVAGLRLRRSRRQPGRLHARGDHDRPSRRDIRTGASQGGPGWGLCLEGERRDGEGQGSQGHLLLQTTGHRDHGHGQEHLGLQEAQALPCRRRGRHLLPEAELRSRPLHMEGVGILQELHVGIHRVVQPAHPRPTQPRPGAGLWLTLRSAL